MRFHVPDMSCGHCTAAIEKAVKTSDPAAEVQTDLPAHTVRVESALSPDAVQDAIKMAGYGAQLVD